MAAPNQRAMDRGFAAPREVSRPANPVSAPVQQQVIQPPVMQQMPQQMPQQTPRMERQPSGEPRREAPAGIAKPEREKEQKEKAEPRNNMRERFER